MYQEERLNQAHLLGMRPNDITLIFGVEIDMAVMNQFC